ncbi:MAG: riboflavin biosynthesis protein RibF [Selenomonadaceae bacterium]|nr:riboflavin biosynthesis protein RibF [Selenomonadaceae bacterium]
MKIYTNFNDIVKDCHGGAVALGTFDGLHVGHRTIIGGALASGKRPAGVVTFANHPLSVLAPDKEPLYIISRDERRKQLAELGIDFLVELEFTAELAAMPPEVFAERLISALRPAAVMVGENYSFGAHGAGDAELLSRYAGELSEKLTGEECQVVVFPLTKTEDGLTVSSTRIREAVQAGKVAEAAVLLGRPFLMDGIVVHGDEQGRTIGFPTANIIPDERQAIPANGAYAVYATMEGDSRMQPAIAAITNKPTAGGRERRLEVHLLDFAGDIYESRLRVSFVEKLRDERKFASFQELKEQLEKDKEQAKEILK